MGGPVNDGSYYPTPPPPWAATAAYLALLAILGSLLAWRWLFGPDDVWAHAAVGRWIYENRQVPHCTLFLWSANEPWVAHSWLSELALYGLLELGVEWVRIAVIVMAIAPFAILWHTWQRQSRAAAIPALLFMVAMACSAARFQARAELVSALLLAGLFAVLIGWLKKQEERSHLRIAAVVSTMVLWVNCHALAPLGAAILLATAICEWAQTRSWRQSRIFALAAVLGVAALFVNPYGAGYLQSLAATSSETFKGIREWRPVWEQPRERFEIVVGTAALASLALAAWIVNPARRWSHLAWLMLLVAAYLSARRFAWMLNITSLAVLAANAVVLDLSWWRQRWQVRSRRPGKGTPPGTTGEFLRAGRIATGVVLAFAAFAATDTIGSPPPGVEPQPRRVCNFILARNIPGRMFNDYENSSYLQWRLAGQPPLFIDLLNAYPDEVYLNYREIIAATPRGQALLDEYRIGYAVLTNFRPGPSLRPLADYLTQSAGWVQIYGDMEAQVWVRRTAEYEDLWRPVEESRARGGMMTGPVE
jgi:hypothetical protein